MCNILRDHVGIGIALLCCPVVALTSLHATAGLNRWTPIGPDGANVAALAIDPHTPSTVYAGTLGAGVLKTTDSGASWVPASGTLSTANVFALAIDPVTTSTLYAGTDAGVFKSTDGGQSWASANAGLVDAPLNAINALALDSGSPATLYAAAYGGVFKTVDGGGTWKAISAALVGFVPRVIAVDPASHAIIYVGGDEYNEFGDYVAVVVFKSTDGGTSWVSIYSAAPPAGIAGIVIDSRSPSRLYLLNGGLLTSANGGKDWQNPYPADDYNYLLTSLAMDPSSSSLYAGTYSGVILVSADAGVHWSRVTSPQLPSNSINVIALVEAAPGAVYAGGRYGLFHSADYAQTWTHPILGVPDYGPHSVAVDPHLPSTIYVAGGDGVAKTTDGGGHWGYSGLGIGGAGVNWIVVDPATTSTLYAGTNGVFPLYKSTDAGVHWTPASNGVFSTNLQALTVAPSRSSTLFVVEDFVGVLKSTDGGSSWTPANNGLAAASVSALAVDATNADKLIVATPPTGQPGLDAKLYKSTNGAAQWREVPIALPAGARIISLAIDPGKPAAVYAAYVEDASGLGRVFRSSDGGETWTVPQNLLPTGCCVTLAIDPHSPSQIYAATQNGLFRSTDAATSWMPFNTGLPNLNVTNIAIDLTGALLRAATPAGLFEYRVSGAIPVIEYVNASSGDFFLAASFAEVSYLDLGNFVGWARTGLRFNVYPVPTDGTAPVCRFFSNAFAPKSAHFYTPFAAECAVVQTNPNWALESAETFYVGVPASDGSCDRDSLPVYRLFNSGQGGVLLHRYTTEVAVRAQMLAQGWVPEGFGPNAVAMCAPF